MGAIEDRHLALGGNAGALGRARGKRVGFRGGELQRFAGGIICARRSTGAVVLTAETADKWLELGGPASSLGLPLRDQSRNARGEDVARFDHGTLRSRQKAAPLSIYQQNAALLGVAYKGHDRVAVLRRLIEYLGRAKPDVVGFSEVFVDAERKRFKRAFADAHGLRRDQLHRYAIEGPDEADTEEDGGLLLLSRFPLQRKASSIYRQFSGVDGASNKGVIHGGIRDDDGIPLDLFLTHMQDPDAAGDARGALRAQYRQLAAFMDAHRSSRRPALLMGDLNTRKSMRSDLMRALGQPQDLWVTGGDGSDGVTTDRSGGFAQPRPLDAPERFQQGDRVDYFLSHRCDFLWPQYVQTRVEILQTSAGHDVSDHYGISTRQNVVRGFAVKVDRPVKRVRASLASFRCLEETDEVGDDDVSFVLLLGDDQGRERRVRSGIFNGVRSGTRRTFRAAPRASLGPIAKHITLTVRGLEHDDGANDSLGVVSHRIDEGELATLIGRERIYTMPLLDRDSGQYVVCVRVEVS